VTARHEVSLQASVTGGRLAVPARSGRRLNSCNGYLQFVVAVVR